MLLQRSGSSWHGHLHTADSQRGVLAPSIRQPRLPPTPAADAEEPANPCICTPRQLAALAATLLNMLLDCFSAAEAAGGFVKTRDNR